MNLSLPFHSENWDSIFWEDDIPPGYWIPESHYWQRVPDGLSLAQRVALNRLETCFSCELFIVFEEYLVRYLQNHHKTLPKFSGFGFEQFLAEEILHQKAFAKLLTRLDPDRYPNGACRFLKWNAWDERVVRVVPRGTLFLMATLFEQITIGVLPTLEDNPAQTCALVAAVMQAHAREEKRHVALDGHVLKQAAVQLSKINLVWQSLLTLPFLAYVDRRIARAWRAAAREFCRSENLNALQTRQIEKRNLSRSDYEGMKSFLKTLAAFQWPGLRLLQAVIRQQVRGYERVR